MSWAGSKDCCKNEKRSRRGNDATEQEDIAANNVEGVGGGVRIRTEVGRTGGRVTRN